VPFVSPDFARKAAWDHSSRPQSSAFDYNWHQLTSVPCLKRLNALLEQPSMRLASLASPAAVSISVVARCHFQRVQGGDQFYRQPLPAVRCRSVQFAAALPVSVARTY